MQKNKNKNKKKPANELDNNNNNRKMKLTSLYIFIKESTRTSATNYAELTQAAPSIPRSTKWFDSAVSIEITVPVDLPVLLRETYNCTSLERNRP